VAPSAQANLYCSTADVVALLSQLGVDARLDDDGSGSVSGGELAVLTQLVNYATARVKFYCAVHYDDADLATSWLVNEWATVIAAHRLSLRRCNPVPSCLRELMYGAAGEGARPGDRGVMGDLEDVRAQRAQIPDIGYRNVPWPAWSNVTVDPRYRVRQIRVQRPISERTPTQYGQDADWSSEFAWEP
jgi:hypothetical protein